MPIDFAQYSSISRFDQWLRTVQSRFGGTVPELFLVQRRALEVSHASGA
jgi:hypothetical protein